MKKLLLLFIFLLQSFLGSSQILSWVKAFGGAAGDGSGLSIILDSVKNSYTVFSYTATVDFDPGPGTFYLTDPGLSDAAIVKLDSLGNFLWAKPLSGTDDINAQEIRMDGVGNLYIVGNYKGTVDFNPGAGIVNRTSIGDFDSFVLKLDNSGNFLWVTSVGSSDSESGTSLTVNNIGECFYTGYFHSTVDFDPGAGVFNMVAGVNPDTYVSKLDASGNFVWAKKLAGSLSTYSSSIQLDASGNVVIVGSFFNTTDFDPGTGTFNLTSGGSSDGYICKLNSSGIFLWAYQLQGLEPTSVQKMQFDAAGNIYICGNFQGTVDFDPGAGTFNVSSVSSAYDMFVLKLNSSGIFLWARSIGGLVDESPYDLDIDMEGNVYYTGYFRGTCDFDPGSATYDLTSAGETDTFISKIDSLGNFVWAKRIGGTDLEYGNGITVSDSGEIFLTGNFYNGPTDFDLGFGIYNLSASGSEGFILKVYQDLCDLNVVVNEFDEIGCDGVGQISINATAGTGPYSYLWNTTPPGSDSTISITEAEIYTVVVSDSEGCVDSAMFLMSSMDTAAFDLKVSAISSTLRAGFYSHIWLDVYNNGCISTAGQLKLVLWPIWGYQYAIPTPDAISGDTLIWNFGPLTYDSTHFLPVITVKPSHATFIGSPACTEAIVTPIIGDQNPSNNTFYYCKTIVGSWDPNFKEVYPPGNCVPGYIPNEELLRYTVHFQNTGTAEAINIFVLDTLDPNLDINTVRVIGQSHSMYTEILPGNVLKFTYDSIMLPDSTSNEPESHGYVIFEVMPDSGLVNGTQITNNVGIYFDFNEPVYTNTVLNTISDGTFFIPVNNTTSLSGATITANESGMTYQWLNCDLDFDSVPGATSQSFLPSFNGNYAVIISDGCFIDTSACVGVFSTGINNTNAHAFSVYPNPSQNTITISTQKDIELSIVNVLGETVLKTTAKDKDVIDISGFSNGIYFIRSEEGAAIRLIKH